MKEKFDLFMQKGGFSVIVAVVCMSLYLGVMSTAQKCSADSLEPVEIKLTDDGNLYLNYIYDDKDDLMVLWETDGGTIKPSKENSDLKEQYTEDNNGIMHMVHLMMNSCGIVRMQMAMIMKLPL